MTQVREFGLDHLHFLCAVCHLPCRAPAQSVVLELAEAALLFALKIDNRSTRSLEVAVAACNQPSAYVTVQLACEIPQHKCVVWRTGFLPTRFVRVTCLAGNPISLYSVQAIGLPLSRIYSDFDPEFWHLMVENTVCSPLAA
jgi:hypothetical protein